MAKRKPDPPPTRTERESRKEDTVNVHKAFIAKILELRASQSNLLPEDLSELVDRWQGIDPSVRHLMEGTTIGAPLFSRAFDTGTFGRDCLSARDIRSIQEGQIDDVRWSHVRNCAACKAFVNAIQETINDPFRNCIKPERFDAFAEGDAPDRVEIEHTRQCLLCMLLWNAMQQPTELNFDEIAKDVRSFARTLASAKG